MGLQDEEVELLLWIDEQSKAWVMGRVGGDSPASHRKSVSEQATLFLHLALWSSCFIKAK